jgi:hypothetical protein
MALAYRGISVIILAPLLALLAVVFSGEGHQLLAVYTQVFMYGVLGFVVKRCRGTGHPYEAQGQTSAIDASAAPQNSCRSFLQPGVQNWILTCSHRRKSLIALCLVDRGTNRAAQ